MNLEKHNPHWKEKFFYQFGIKRTIFNIIVNNINNRQVISISGLRRTGKTVLMKQLIDHLIEKSIERTSILYYSFDEEQPKIEEIINEFEKLTGHDKNKGKIYVFFDEIQKLENWQDQIKYYYDNFNIKFFVSGSSSLFIKKKVKESLAGRSFDFYLKPLSFREFLIFRKKHELIEKRKLFSHELKKEFSLYVKRQFVEIVDESENYVSDYTKSIIEKVIFIDIPKVFPIAYADLLLRLIRIIASNPGMIIEYGELSKELGINRVTLSNYLFYLEEAFLVKKIYNFSRNRITSEKKAKKFYLSSTSFYPYLSPELDESKCIENLVAVVADSRFFWRTPFKEEVDFVFENFNNIKFLPVEVKYKNTISEKDTKGVLKFCKKFNLNFGVVITKDLEEEKIFKQDEKKIKIKFIPAWQFLLSYQN